MPAMHKTYFLHGLGQNSDIWKRVTAHLVFQTDVVCPDLFSVRKNELISYEQVYQEFAREVSLSGEKINLCGLSLGAVLALQYGIEYPEKVNAAVLIAAQYKMPRGLLSLQNMVFRLMPESSFRDTRLSKHNMIHLTGSMKHLDFSRNLSRIDFPVLLLCGENDRTNRKATLELADRIPHAEAKFITGAGHEVNKDTPDVLAQILSDFFSATE